MYISKKQLVVLVDLLGQCQAWVEALLEDGEEQSVVQQTPTDDATKRECLHCGAAFELRGPSEGRTSKKFCREEHRRAWWTAQARVARETSAAVAGTGDVEAVPPGTEPIVDAIAATLAGAEVIDLFVPHKKGSHTTQAPKRDVHRPDPLDVKFDQLTSACVGENLGLDELRDLFEDEWPTCYSLYLRARGWRRIGQGLWAAPTDVAGRAG